ncbi:MAG: LysR family transcriptional regulator [Burkholderiales bacterium]|nr:LysR family transcriptional regulator [Anaerolineae bacterium]
MNLTQFETLIAIADTGSFTEAAERVGVTRSAASHALANLEAELGVALLERERGSVTPTAIGNCVLHHAREILANVESIQQHAADARGLQSGKLRIGVVSSLSAKVLSGILRKFRQEYPHIEIVTFEGAGHEVEDWILSSTVDVGFTLRATEGIEGTVIGQDEARVLIPNNHPLRKHRSVTWAALADEPFILPKLACDFIGATWQDTKDLARHKRYEASDVQTIIAMVREGLGISILPEMLLPSQLEGLSLLSLEPPLRFMFGVGVRSMRHASPAAKLFIQSAESWANANGFEREVGEHGAAPEAMPARAYPYAVPER